MNRARSRGANAKHRGHERETAVSKSVLSLAKRAPRPLAAGATQVTPTSDARSLLQSPWRPLRAGMTELPNISPSGGMSTLPFVHLHCHSHYSLLDGAGSLERLLERTKELGMNSLALTDHGNLYGALEFYEMATAAGIKPIIGYEAYVAPQDRFHKDAASMKEASFHLTLLAKDRTGFKNLLKMAVCI